MCVSKCVCVWYEFDCVCQCGGLYVNILVCLSADSCVHKCNRVCYLGIFVMPEPLFVDICLIFAFVFFVKTSAACLFAVCNYEYTRVHVLGLCGPVCVGMYLQV